MHDQAGAALTGVSLLLPGRSVDRCKGDDRRPSIPSRNEWTSGALRRPESLRSFVGRPAAAGAAHDYNAVHGIDPAHQSQQYPARSPQIPAVV
jgi:hypothetical protein